MAAHARLSLALIGWVFLLLCNFYDAGGGIQSVTAAANGVDSKTGPPSSTYSILVLTDDNSIEGYNYLNMSVDCLDKCVLPPTFKSPASLDIKINLDLVDMSFADLGRTDGGRQSAIVLCNQLCRENELLRKKEEQVCDALSTYGPSFVISLVTQPSNIQIVRQVASMSKIPTIQYDHKAWVYNEFKTGSNKTVEPAAVSDSADIPNYMNIVPAGTVYSNIVLDIKEAINITTHSNVAVLYETDMDIHSLSSYIERSGIKYEKIDIDSAVDEIDVQAILRQLDAIQPSINTVIMVAKRKTVETLFFKADSVIKEQLYRWIVVTPDTQPFACDECPWIYALWVRPDIMEASHTDYGYMRAFKGYLDMLIRRETPLPGNQTVTAQNELYVSFFLDSIFLAWERIQTMVTSAVTYPTYSCKANTSGVFELTPNATEYAELPLKEYVSEQPLATFGSYTFTDEDPETAYVDVIGKFTSYVREKTWFISKTVGNWTVNKGVAETYESLTVDIREITAYRVVIVVKAPFVERLVDPDTGYVTYTGYCVQLMELIAEKLRKDGPFEYTIYEAPDAMYGSINDRNEWNGMMGELLNGEADIALGALSVMAERENYIDFTVPYYDLVGTTILMKRTQPESNMFEFISVLEPIVWLIIGSAYLVTVTLLYLFDKYSPYSYTNNKEKYKDDPEQRVFTFKECLWFCMTSLTPQGGGEAPKNVSGRLVAATWWLFGFIIIASYTANLAAFLTVARMEVPIKGIDDLASQWKVKYSPARGTSHETYFKRMAEIESKFYDLWKEMSLNKSIDAKERAKLAVWDYPVSDKYTNIWRFMQQSKLPPTVQDAIDRVKASTATTQYAYVGDATDIDYAVMTDCNLMKVGSQFSRKPYAIAVQQGSPLKTRISKAILHLLNERQLERLRETWWMLNPNKVKCPKPPQPAEGISIRNIGGVFIVILGGIVLSVVILTVEYFYYKDKPVENASGAGDNSQHHHNTNNNNGEAAGNKPSHYHHQNGIVMQSPSLGPEFRTTHNPIEMINYGGGFENTNPIVLHQNGLHLGVHHRNGAVVTGGNTNVAFNNVE